MDEIDARRHAAASQVLRLLPSVPNPFNPSTTLHFLLGRPAIVDLAIYDIAGRRVR